MNYLSVENISKSIGERTLFTGITFGLNKGQKAALVAKNGTGKSTILRIIAGLDKPDDGKITYRNEIKVAYLDQEPELPAEQSIIDSVFQSDDPVIEVIREYENCIENPENQEALQKAMDKMDSHNAWDFEQQIRQILSVLKLDNLQQKIKTLSGGQKKRIAMAQVLVRKPDLLILDEPTNHLDVEMIEWLEKYLSQEGLTLLMVTHDRYFLDRICNEIIELESGQLYQYKGNYSYYLEKKAERQAVEAANVEKAKSLYRKELDWMRRQPKARGTKAKARVEAFDDLKDKAKTRLQKDELKLEVKTERLGGKILELHNIGKSYGDKKLIEGFDYKFKTGERVSIVGPNGSGKTTLLKLIMQQIQPDTGKIVVGETVKFGYYSQSGLQVADDKRMIEVVKDIAEYIQLPGGKKISAAQMLERFLFQRSSHYTYVSKLSGGEKRRLYLLTVLMDNPNFLILDEPTNDLDILTLNVLEEFLMQYKGCLVIVSHDRYFMDKLTDHLFVFEGDGDIRDFWGTYTEYRELKKAEEAKSKRQEKQLKKSTESPKEKKTIKFGFNEKREFAQLEKDIEQLEADKKALTEKLNSGGLDHQEMQELSAEIANVMQELETKSDRWLELSELAG